MTDAEPQRPSATTATQGDLESGGSSNSSEATEVEQKYERLFEHVDKTSYNVFNAARRLRTHNTLSLWAVVVMSLCAIALALAQGLSLQASVSKEMITFLSIFSSIGVLVYSIMLNMSDFNVRSGRFHQCGVELLRLRARVFKEKVRGPNARDQYNSLSEEYATILDKYDNHSNLDYMMMKVRSREYKDDYGVGPVYTAWVWFLYVASFWHYLLFMSFSVTGVIRIILSVNGTT